MALERITLHLTDRCQLNCDHCLRDPGKAPIDLPLPLIESVLDQARAAFASRHVALTGGEPTLHPELYAIVDAIVDRGYTWRMISNGARFEHVAARLAARPERLAGLTVVNFSLDGATPEVNDSIREQGNFAAVLRAASVCHGRGIPFLLQMTLNARNVDQIEELALLASQLGARHLAYHFTQPAGTFLDRTLYLPASEWRRAWDRVQRACATFRIEMSHSHSAPHAAPLRLCDVWQHEELHVDHHGRLTLCCQHAGVPSDGTRSDVLGDLREVSLVEAHRRFTELVHETLRARLELIAQPGISEWDKHFSCNWCLARFGRPHWTDEGVGGPTADRVRWRGRWKPGYKDSHRAADPALADAPNAEPRSSE